MHSRNTFSLLTFSVSRIPFREDSPADIIPPRRADRSVVQKRYLAANTSEKYHKCHKYSFSRQLFRESKILFQVGTFYNQLNCSSLLTPVSVSVSWDGASFSSSVKLLNGAEVSRESFCPFPKSGWVSYSVVFVTRILQLLLHCPLVGESNTPFNA